MTETGMSTQEALEYILEETDNKALTKAIAYILEDIRGGSMDAWEAFTRHPGIFDSVFCALVKSGETTGAGYKPAANSTAGFSIAGAGMLPWQATQPVLV